jgi:hypothetical protein
MKLRGGRATGMREHLMDRREAGAVVSAWHRGKLMQKENLSASMRNWLEISEYLNVFQNETKSGGRAILMI